MLDYVDVLVHVMKAETRAHYDLEGLWNDAPRVRVTKRKAAKKSAGKKAAEAAASAGEPVAISVQIDESSSP